MNLKRIYIGKKTYPLYADLSVLEVLQEDYGSIYEWERDILGLRFVKDKDGKQVYTKDGEPMLESGEPRVRAIRTALGPMINSGLWMEAHEAGKEYEPIDEGVLRTCSVPYSILAKMIYAEYKRCFETKKADPGAEKEKGRRN